MKNEIWQVFAGEPVVLCGDGRNASPGHNAKYCTYVLMEQFLEVIIDVDVVDMRIWQIGKLQFNGVEVCN